MTYLEVLKLAWDAQLMRWSREKEILEQRPYDSIAGARIGAEWAKLQELGEMLKAEEPRQAQG